MSELAAVAAVGLATTLATGLGVLPVWWLGTRVRDLTPALEGAVAGIMLVAAVAGLIIPAFQEGRPGAVAGGIAVGVAFLLATRSACPSSDARFRGMSSTIPTARNTRHWSGG